MGHADYAQNGTDFDAGINCPFKTVDEVYNFDACKEYGEKEQEELVKELNTEYHKEKEYRGDSTLTMGGVYITLFSRLIEIFGWEMLLTAMGENPKKFDKVIESYYLWIKQYFDAWAKTDAEVCLTTTIITVPLPH